MMRSAQLALAVLCTVALWTPPLVWTLTVDNQLVSARNDCFERIALEAMLPFEKTFRTEDTNSLKMCKEKCIQAGDKCQAIAFGVHRRGNGTCQLSGEKYGMTSGRPREAIFDPDFDLYARKNNCFDLSDNSIPTSDTLSVGESGGYGGPPGLSSPPPNRPPEATTILLVNPTTTTTQLDDRPASPTFGYDTTPHHLITEGPVSTMGPTTSDGDRIYFNHEIYPLYKYPMLYEHNYPAPNEDVYIPGGYASNVPEVDERYRPTYTQDDRLRPTPNGPPRPIFGLGYGNGYSYGKPERYNPTTMRPYDQAPQNDRDRDRDRDRPNYTTRPGTYDHGPQNDRDRDRDRDRPNYTTRPGPYPNAPQNDRDRDRPNYSPRPSSSYPDDRPAGPNGRPRPGHDYTTPSTYYTRPSYGPNGMPSADQRPPAPTSSAMGGHRPGDFVDYTNRPDPPAHGGYDGGASTRPPRPGGYNGADGGGAAMNPNRYDYVRRNGTAVGGADGYNNDDKTIATFFNPEDYMNGGKKRPGGSYADRVGYPADQMQACFRRVLAGKRVAPHWVRRTIACERVEECMRECGHEKRFMCEGFNYRLDPTGHGQGDCELIEIPLAQMDLYSSSNQRDSNLLRHPDYDYYERDRNAPSSCRRNLCKDCSKGTLSSPPLYFKPSGGGGGGGSGWGEKPYREDHYLPASPTSSGYGSSESHRPYGPSSSTAVDRYRPPGPSRPISYEHSPHSSSEYHSNSYEFSSHGSSYYEHTPPSSYGGGSGTGSGAVDRYDLSGPDDHRYRPNRWESIPSSSGYESPRYPSSRPSPESDRYRPAYRPHSGYSPYRPHSSHDYDRPSGPPSSYSSGLPPPPPLPSSHNYLDREGPQGGYKKPGKIVPYLIGSENNWGSYGGSYGGSYNKQSSYWGLSESQRRRDPHDFNYFALGGSRKDPPRESEPMTSYPGSSYDGHGGDRFRDRHDYRHQWTRRPGPDECSAKTSEGFRLHKGAVRHSYSVPTLTECERLCSGQDGFACQTYSYRYTPMGRDNCMLCDRPVNMLDYYVDIEPDRDYDIYSMADDLNTCRKPARGDGRESTTALSDPRNAQCFFRAIDASRFFKSIVRDSLTVRTVGECEMECIKSTKFTCRAFAYRYGKQRHASVIDNCQLSDWPVRDMDKERHLIRDSAFDVFERASYGHGCEIQPIVDEKHKNLCYLGYGSPARLLPAAIKKVTNVPSESDCKKECIRFRETTPFKCYSFSYGSRGGSHNCEMSDLDQTELKLSTHYTHTNDRDYWLFAWNPFDWTCRDKTNTIGGSRVNNDRRMDIFREPGDVTWRHYTVSGKACRRSSPCEKNLVTGFYSCEIDGGEIGSWDYCCKADHPCGYSRGFDYPWCFVGDEPDQWRKCSDRYYPGNSTHTHTHAHTHSSISLPPSKDDRKKHPIPLAGGAGSDEYQHPPRPGGLQSLSDFAAARLWPVTYLYSEGPPNSTEFSNFVDCNKESC